MADTPARGSLEHVMDRLEELGGTIHPTLEVHRWWRPDMSLPALWHWMTPGDVEGPAGAGDAGGCLVYSWARITVTIGVDPTAVAGEGDLLQLETYHDLALPIYAGAIYGRNPLGQRMARMRGVQTVADELGGIAILSLELPLEVRLDVNAVQTNP